MNAGQYIDHLASQGRYHFATEEAARALDVSPVQLMSHLGEPYYVGLLSAAEYHGAAHHHPQQLQVVTGKNRPALDCGAVIRSNARDFLVRLINNSRGTIRVSTPEATALDLVGYPEHSAGLDNVATVLSELADSLDPDRLAEAVQVAPPAGATVFRGHRSRSSPSRADWPDPDSPPRSPRPLAGSPEAELWGRACCIDLQDAIRKAASRAYTAQSGDQFERAFFGASFGEAPV
jgi:hypothetical protein